MSDMMDDFEFKPLTEGLGFHNRKEKATAQNKSIPAPPTPSREATSDSAVGSASLRKLSTPLPRSSGTESTATGLQPSLEMPSTTVDEILKTLNSKKRPDIATSTTSNRISEAPVAVQYVPASWDFSAFLLDLMLVSAMTLLCLLALVVTTKVDLFANILNPESSRLIYLSLGLLVAGLTWIYTVTSRIFLGSTPGEWVFDQRIGQPEAFGTSSYYLKIALRSTVVILTGFIVVPLLSLIFRRDIVGEMLGAELLKQF